MKPPIFPPPLPPDLESYEARAERVLEEQREGRVVSIAPELDYIDEEDEDVQPQVQINYLIWLRVMIR